jgi:RHS repeat-associated protein
MTWQTSYYHYDGQGSTLCLTNENGDVTDQYAYTAYGEEVDTGAMNPTPNPFRYVGQQGYYRDADTEDYYVRGQVYEPALARWLSPDPVQLTGREFHSRYDVRYTRQQYVGDLEQFLDGHSRIVPESYSLNQMIGGEANCNPKGWLPTWKVAPTTACTRWCSVSHELTHVLDFLNPFKPLGICCWRARLAYHAAGSASEKKEVIRVWNIWQTNVEPLIELPAREAELTCMNAMWHLLRCDDCLRKPLPSWLPELPPLLRRQGYSMYAWVRNCCTRIWIDRQWSEHWLSYWMAVIGITSEFWRTCPFNAKGKIILEPAPPIPRAGPPPFHAELPPRAAS